MVIGDGNRRESKETGEVYNGKRRKNAGNRRLYNGEAVQQVILVCWAHSSKLAWVTFWSLFTLPFHLPLVYYLFI